MAGYLGIQSNNPPKKKKRSRKEQERVNSQPSQQASKAGVISRLIDKISQPLPEPIPVPLHSLSQSSQPSVHRPAPSRPSPIQLSSFLPFFLPSFLPSFGAFAFRLSPRLASPRLAWPCSARGPSMT
ncbi:predicted protein [Plenodomus lingam JN3]|uniref:Predicted protein n=1 Tax=Leptosphaeria maculans (strain JN3 / isolate v23.1.3 / race Av1-4-5-6-7-8) TaxID=985895 RepID=E4ZZI3_LEPMJ|nr:predicted protein [Plenodomus lingam JN3]CBX97099.1 predicted protein [Plenodomus lingam JN3]